MNDSISKSFQQDLRKKTLKRKRKEVENSNVGSKKRKIMSITPCVDNIDKLLNVSDLRSLNPEENNSVQRLLCKILNVEENESLLSDKNFTDFLWDKIQTLTAQFYENSNNLDNKKTFKEKSKKIIYGMHNFIVKYYEKVMDNQPLIFGKSDTETRNRLQTHPLDLCYDTIKESIEHVSEPEHEEICNKIGEVLVLRELESQKVVEKEKRLNNNNDKIPRYKGNNPFFN